MSTKKKPGIDFKAPSEPSSASEPEPAFPPYDAPERERSEGVERWIVWLTGEVYAGAQIADDRSKRVLSRTFAEQVARHRILTQREALGKLAADVGRTVPAVSRQIRDLARELGITAKKKATGGGFV